MRLRSLTRTLTMLVLVAAIVDLSDLVPPTAAASPLPRINYQGVLRNAAGAALDGDHDMVFRFWSAAAGGDEIMVDDWSQGVGGPVQVNKGLFSVPLGAGFPTDGAGPGVYTSLADVFRDYSLVYLEVKVGAEVLSPRTLILSVPAALNSDRLDGKSAADFIDASATQQTKSGRLFLSDGMYATSSSGGYGTESYGAIAGGFFADSDQSGFAELGLGDYGMKGSGNLGGGRFQDLDSTGLAIAGYGDQGLNASGSVEGVFGFGSGATGYGVHGQGVGAGGFFEDRFGTGQAIVGKDDRGIEAQGSEMGGSFKDTDNTGTAYLGYSTYGVYAFGTTAGGYFADAADSGFAYLGFSDYGVRGFGETAGAYFGDSNGTGSAYVGKGDLGIEGSGQLAGAHFTDTNGSGSAYLGIADIGVSGSGSDRGGFFTQTGGSGSALVAWNERGIQATGLDAGGYFGDTNTSSFALVGYGAYKIFGSGAMSFVQNHPSDEDRVIVYTAPEGDETATYTRGTARLVNGEAQVPLGETFALVTNPDLGLTAYVTPRDRAVPLAVASLGTDTLGVRGPAGEDIVFDYIVYGLRIGFEETTVVQEKTQEARIPSMAKHRQRVAEHPELRRFTARARFAEMETAAGRPPRGNGRAAALVAAIEEHDPARHGRPRADREPGEAPASAVQHVPATAFEPAGRPPEDPGADARDRAGTPRDPAAQSSAEPLAGEPGIEPGDALGYDPRAVETATLVLVGEPVETGDVLVADPEAPGVMRRGKQAADRAVVGIVTGEPGMQFGAAAADDGAVIADARGSAPLAMAGFALCKVDAAYGSIRVGDLLATSPTAGHAMRADQTGAGTILGKALEPLESGTGIIRVLVTLR